MPLDDARYSLETPVTIEMTTLTGDRLALSVRTLDVGPDRVDLSGFVSADVWNLVTRLGAFHTDLEPGEVPEQAGVAVEIVVTLRSPWIDRFDDNDELFRALVVGDDPEHERLAQTDAWLLASAMRELAVPGDDDASAAAGYRTRWASPLY